MTSKERKQRCLAARSKRLRDMAPNYPGIVMTAAEMMQRLGWNLPTMSSEQLAALRAQPGGDCIAPEDEEPALDEFGEPVYE
jgi:hypothetical protein